MVKNEDFLAGINETELDDIVLNLNTDIDSISNIFSQIQMLFYDTSTYFTGSVADSIREKFDFYDKQINTVKDNLKAYSNDLIKVKALMGEIDVASSLFMDDKKSNINKRTTNANEKVAETVDSLTAIGQLTADMSMTGFEFKK